MTLNLLPAPREDPASLVASDHGSKGEFHLKDRACGQALARDVEPGALLRTYNGAGWVARPPSLPAPSPPHAPPRQTQAHLGVRWNGGWGATG